MGEPVVTIEIVHLRELGGFLGHSEGFGIFVPFGKGRMQVGAIIPRPDGKFSLNIDITADLQIQDYDLGDFSATYDSFDDATDSAQSFLRSKRKQD